MKTASFLRCGVVIVLLLITGRVGAQIDSNAFVKIYCAPITEGCTAMVTCSTYTNRGTFGGYTEDEQAAETVGIDGYFRLSDRSHDGNNSWWFDIDSINSQIINFTLMNGVFTPYPSGSIYSGAWDSIKVTFDNIFFVKTDSGIHIIPGKYPCKYAVQSEINYTSQSGQLTNHCVGGCDDTGSTMDSVFLEISLASSIVSNFVEQNIPFRVTSDGANEMFSFNSSSSGGYLNVIDMLGRIAFSIFLLPSETWHEVQLEQFPPGCYFARLGDQVAKFVVPPR